VGRSADGPEIRQRERPGLPIDGPISRISEPIPPAAVRRFTASESPTGPGLQPAPHGVPVMRIALALVALALVPTTARADRISQMTREERCTYTAKLHVAAAYHYRKGLPRAEFKLYWHGDETPGEIEFVTRVVDQGYEAMQREVEAGRADIPLEFVGDKAFEACMKESKL
jgi:hypothetical protein